MDITKVFNLVQIFSGYIISRISRNVIHWGYPVSVSIEPTNCCNLRCPECPSGQNSLTREKGFLDTDLFTQLVSDIRKETHFITLYFQGEPYMHPKFSQLVALVKAKNLHITTSTNGHFLNEENARLTVLSGLDKLIVSLDGSDESSYSSYRKGGNFEKVVEGIREIIQQRKKLDSQHPKIILQFIVLKTNEHQLPEIKKTGKLLGVDSVEIKTAQLYEFEGGHPLMPENKKYSRYKQITDPSGNKAFRIRNQMPRHCFRMWSSCVITWDGWVVPCCYDKDAKYKMGNIRDEPFEMIWRGSKYKEFRKNILHHRESLDICRNCAEGMGITRIL